MKYTLNRIEGEYGVLVASDGMVVNVLTSELECTEIGSVFELCDEKFIYNSSQTEETKNKSRNVFDKFKSKHKKG